MGGDEACKHSSHVAEILADAGKQGLLSGVFKSKVLYERNQRSVFDSPLYLRALVTVADIVIGYGEEFERSHGNLSCLISIVLDMLALVVSHNENDDYEDTADHWQYSVDMQACSNFHSVAPP
jgi:hypothetical protein